MFTAMHVGREWVRCYPSMSTGLTGRSLSDRSDCCHINYTGPLAVPDQLEAFAVYYAVCVKWRYYLSLNKTVIHTDHRDLSWLFRQSQKGLIGRWYAHLCTYDLDITYVQGKTQVVADPLSRLLKTTTNDPQWIVDRSRRGQSSDHSHKGDGMHYDE